MFLPRNKKSGSTQKAAPFRVAARSAFSRYDPLRAFPALENGEHAAVPSCWYLLAPDTEGRISQLCSAVAGQSGAGRLGDVEIIGVIK
jgi:hypothetical protein